jgi:serine kinase of HPr protein (carbohydrate metabolism regulator)
MIHASGMNYSGKGYLFSGVSGKGKTTIAHLWENSGAKVIHDDRLILRKTNSGYIMYNTPVYNNDEPLESPLNRIFIIDHGTANKIVPVKGASAISLVMANCIQHNWGPEIIAKLLGAVSIMCEKIPVARLFFVPDQSVTDLILDNE